LVDEELSILLRRNTLDFEARFLEFFLGELFGTSFLRGIDLVETDVGTSLLENLHLFISSIAVFIAVVADS